MAEELSGDEAFETIRAHCLAKEGAIQDSPWDHAGFKVRDKLFCIGTTGSGTVTVKSTVEKQAGLVLHPNISVAAYVGRYGWVTVDAVDRDTLALTLELIDESYELITARKPRKASRMG